MVMGSGTMNDLGKWAATVLDIPYVVIATAPSMNGYTSSISALSEGAFKSTQDVRPAAAVIADVDIMKDAPIEMIRAGMGDLLSKNVCNADWRLSHRLKDTYFCELPHRLTRGQERYYFEHARELGRRDSEAVRMLTEAVMNSGFSMAIVGLASPSSGSEHLMSHYWEMQNEMAGRALSLHGAQVGVGTLIAAEIYERVLRMGPGGIDLERARRSYRSLEELKPVVSKHYGPLADRTFEHTARKVVPWPETERQLITLKEDWDDIWRDVGRFLRTRAELEHVMREAGCPTRASDLNISRDDTYNAIRYARLLRNRYTILDVADEAGWLEHWADDLADEFTG
jgi:glycerol-1-phosphate dehydrogenase [NAD(P)+]